MEENITFDLTDIDFSKVKNYVSINVEEFNKILKQLGTIINLKGSKLSRGITLKIWDSNTVIAICPNELYYFNAELSAITTFERDTCIYLDYVFLQKIYRFTGGVFYIFELDGKYYLRLQTGNLELLNPSLLKEEKERIDRGFSIVRKEATYKLGDLLPKLRSLYSITDFEVEANKRWINSKDGVVTFKSPLLMAKAEFDFIDAKVDYKILNYLNYICGSTSDMQSEIEVYSVESSVIPKYALCYNKTTMVANYPKSSDALKVLSIFDDLPKFTMINYADLEYKLEYADSITYAKGVVTFINRDDKLIGKIKLQNNSETEVEIPVLGEMCLKKSEQIKVNFRTLLVALGSLDNDLETYFGLKDGLLYLINRNISLAMVTF